MNRVYESDFTRALGLTVACASCALPAHANPVTLAPPYFPIHPEVVLAALWCPVATVFFTWAGGAYDSVPEYWKGVSPRRWEVLAILFMLVLMFAGDIAVVIPLVYAVARGLRMLQWSARFNLSAALREECPMMNQQHMARSGTLLLMSVILVPYGLLRLLIALELFR